jgi:alanine-synthesizing transaminase
MISSRLPADLSLNATARAAGALRASGVSLIDLTESNPTRAGLAYPPGVLNALADARALQYEPHPLGLMAAREAVAADFRRRGLAVSPDRIGLTASSSEAYAFLFKLFCDPGDAVLVPQPSYPLFDHLTRLESVRPAPYALEYHGSWRIDMDSVRRAIDDRARALLVVSPNNPTGSFLHGDDLVQLTELCAAHDLALIGDEVFADFALDPSPAARSVLAQADVITCSLGGLSKSIGLPQIKLGWIGFAGPSAKLAEVLTAYEVIADAYLSVSTPVQVAAPALLADGVGMRAQIHARVASNLARLRDLAADYPAVRVLTCEGGWSAVVHVPALGSEEALVLHLLTEDHVLVHPGYFFDFEREAFLVVSLLLEPDLFAQGVSRLLARATTPIPHP